MPRCFLVTSTMSRHIEKNETRNENRSFHMKRKKKSFIKTRKKNRSSHLGKKSLIPSTTEASLRGAQRVDGTAPRVLQHAADVPQGLVRRVVSAVCLAFLGCGRYAVGVPFLELVAAGGEERTEVGVPVSYLLCAGAQQGGDFLFCGPDVMEGPWRVRSGGAPVWLVSHSMPHACAARRMAMVSVGASGRRRMACRALLYLCQAPWSSSAENCSVGGRVSSGRGAAGGG